MNTVGLQVSGIQNAQMKTSLKNALDKLEGVQEVDIDTNLGTIEVGFNQPADENGIIACAEKTGCTVMR